MSGFRRSGHIYTLLRGSDNALNLYTISIHKAYTPHAPLHTHKYQYNVAKDNTTLANPIFQKGGTLTGCRFDVPDLPSC